MDRWTLNQPNIAKKNSIQLAKFITSNAILLNGSHFFIQYHLLAGSVQWVVLHH